MKATGMGLSFAVAVVLARALGPEGYGLYSYVFALVSLLAIPAQFGLPILVVRETAKAEASANWPMLNGIWLWAAAAAGVLSFVLAGVAGIFAWLFSGYFNASQLITFMWGMVLVPGLVMGRLVGAGLRGLRYVVSGQLPDIVLRPGILVVLALGAMFFWVGRELSPSEAMALHSVAAGTAFLLGFILLIKVRPPASRGIKARYEHYAWVQSALPLGLIAGMQIINSQADIIMLGILADARDVGIYRVAVQGATLAAFGLQVVNMVVAPQFVRLHSQGRQDQLQRLVTLSARAALAIALPIVLFFVFFGGWLLTIAVGPDYAGGSLALTILGIGQLINASAGSVTLLLNMTDYEHVVARGVILGACFNIMANLLLIPLWGINGAALATAATMLILNGLFAWKAYKRLNINSTAFNGFPIFR